MKVSVQPSRLAMLATVFAFAVSLHAGEKAKAKEAAAAKKSAAVAATKTAAAENSAAGGKTAARGARGAEGMVNGLSSGPLPEAYRLLESADHDYNGHRALAMRHVKEAARLIGEEVSGRRGSVEHVAAHGGEPEAQAASDDQLRRAQSLLQQVAGRLSGEALQHVQTAIQHLSIALNVR
jgi:hypothetical protein